MSTSFHLNFTASGCIDAHLRALMLPQLLTTGVVLSKMDTMVLIKHMTPSWPPSYL